MVKISKKILLFILLLQAVLLNAEERNRLDKSVLIDWKINKQQISFPDAVYPKEFSGLPVYSYSVNIYKNTNVEITVSNPVFKPLTESNLTLDQIKVIESQLVITKTIGIDRKNNVATVTVFPFVKNNGQIEILSSFDLNIAPQSNSANRLLGTTERVYASNSMLSAGKWFKFGVPKSGVYKLDYSFLKNLGIAVDAINPSDIRIFGHRAGMLPELAGAPKEDDIREIPLKVISAVPNRFQANDYVLAFLPGPEQWKYNTSRQFFEAKKHLYSDTKNFFITAESGAGARINTVNSSPLPETKNISTYNDYAYFEENKVNIAQSGKQFLGDEFGGITDKSYNFNLPNLIWRYYR